MATANPTSLLRGLILVLPWLLWLFMADVMLSALLPLKPLSPDTVYNASSAIAYSVWVWIQNLFERLNGAVITISGDALPTGESAIVVANHTAWSDFYMIQKVAIRAGMLGRCRWFAKIQLRNVPFLGWGLWAMGMPLVSRRWMKDRVELEKVFSGIVRRRWPIWLISFSEATRFTSAKFAESQAFCAANSRPQPQHLLYPRTRGFVTTVQHLRSSPHVRAVYDFTIAYQHGREWHAAPSMWETLSEPGLSTGAEAYKFHVHVRRFPIDHLPREDDELAKWLEQRWLEKGLWLEEKRKEWVGEVGKDKRKAT